MSGGEVFVSVDVETSGPVPGEFSMLSLGACMVDEPERSFQCVLKPIGERADPRALEVSGLSIRDLELNGLEPAVAMRSFSDWITGIAAGGKPVFVGLNAPFDWSFVNYYFHRFLRENPFGFSALDIKAYYMGATGCTWRDTRSSAMAEHLQPTLAGTHDALEDARYQAELFRAIRELVASR